MKKRKLIFLLPLLIAAAVAGYQVIQDSLEADPSGIRVSGNIEVTDVDVSFKIAGRVEQRLVSEGEMVRAGELVAGLDRHELLQEMALRRAEERAAAAALSELLAGSRPEEIREAEAAASKAQARLEELLAGSRAQEIDAQRASLRRATAEMERLAAEHERQATLLAREVISEREYEAAEAAYEVAKARASEEEERLKLLLEGPRKEQIEQARAAVRQANERLALVRKGPRQETIDQARARLEQAKQSLAMAETRLGYATVQAPLTGVVLSENVEPGMYVAAGTPVITVGDLENVWLRAYINETDLGRVKVGQPVRVTTDTYSDKHYDGRISFIASEAEFTPKNVQTEKERVKLVYRVKIDISNLNMELKPGMPADAEILLEPSSLDPQLRESRLKQGPREDTRKFFRRAVWGAPLGNRQRQRLRALNEILRAGPATFSTSGAPTGVLLGEPRLLLAREIGNARH